MKTAFRRAGYSESPRVEGEKPPGSNPAKVPALIDRPVLPPKARWPKIFGIFLKTEEERPDRGEAGYPATALNVRPDKASLHPRVYGVRQ